MAVVLGGCGSSHDAQVSGMVTFDGKPLTVGDVAFHGPAGTPGYGTIQPDGSYRIATAGKPGLKSGEYVVTVVALAPPIVPASGGMPAPGKHLIPVTYASVDSTELKFTVIPSDNHLDLKLLSR